MEIIITILIKAICLGFVLTGLPDIYRNILTIGKRKRLIDFLGLMNCIKCNAFWIALVLSQDIWIASAASLIAFIIDNYLLGIRL